MMKDLHKEVKLICGKNKSSPRGNIKNKDGDVLFEKEDILKRWEEYIGELFHDTRSEIPSISNTDGPPILEREVEAAIEGAANGKVPGKYRITTEMLKALGAF